MTIISKYEGHLTTTAVLRHFAQDYPGESVPKETFTQSHLSWSSLILYLLSPSTIHSILPVQFCSWQFLHNLSPSPLWSTSRSVILPTGGFEKLWWVGLFVWLLKWLRNHVLTSQIFCTLPLAMAWSSSDSIVICYVVVQLCGWCHVDVMVHHVYMYSWVGWEIGTTAITTALIWIQFCSVIDSRCSWWVEHWQQSLLSTIALSSLLLLSFTNEL